MQKSQVWTAPLLATLNPRSDLHTNPRPTGPLLRQHNPKPLLVLTLTVLGLFCFGCFGPTSHAASSLINGAGATFPYPIYSKWFSEYEKINPDVRINYMSIGSGGGIRQFTENTVDFGATDSPMSTELLAKSSVPILHIPTVLGAVVVSYNLPGIPSGLKLSGEVLADLYLGKIQKWNDPRLAKLNSHLSLPDTAVIVARRSDGSGTTAVFTDYLAKVSAQWKTQVGSGTAVRWPTGLGGKGNEGVAGIIKQTPGALGYVELVFAETNHLSYAAVQNKSLDFVLPSLKSVTAAAQSMLPSMPEDFRVSITDALGKGAYPISSFTYLLVHNPMPKDKGQKLVDFLHWALKGGQKYTESLYYAPLPPSLAKKVDQKVSQISLK